MGEKVKRGIRNPDGTFAKGSLQNAEKQFTRFGSNVIKGGRRILNERKKRKHKKRMLILLWQQIQMPIALGLVSKTKATIGCF